MRSPPGPSLGRPRRRRPTMRSTTLRKCLATGCPLPVPLPLTTLPRLTLPGWGGTLFSLLTNPVTAKD
eukprot:2294734-Prorocentrum_lima.AAC.1